VDANGGRLKLASVNWYGAEEQEFAVSGLDHRKLSDIAADIKIQGFNSVRLPWSNDLIDCDPIVDASVVGAAPGGPNFPQLANLHAIEVYDRVIDALAAAGLLVVIDNHNTTANWCCDNGQGNDGNHLWYASDYASGNRRWLDDWTTMASRYRNQPAVVGVDLRNEPRGAAKWEAGNQDPEHNWRNAAEVGGNAVLAANPNLLIMVEGTDNGNDLSQALQDPVNLCRGDRLVYEPHEYYYFASAKDENARAGRWGNLAQSQPVWLGEFGTNPDGVTSPWFTALINYLKVNDTDWGYWAVNGTMAKGVQDDGKARNRTITETYGLMCKDWTFPGSSTCDAPVHPLLNALVAIEIASNSAPAPSRQESSPPCQAQPQVTPPIYGTGDSSNNSSFGISCTSSGQPCTPAFQANITTDGTVPVQVKYTVTGHCSSVLIHFGLDGVERGVSPILGWVGGPAGLPLSYSLELGVVSAGQHTLQIAADGVLSGCNGGGLASWGGSVAIVGAFIAGTTTGPRPKVGPASIPGSVTWTRASMPGSSGSPTPQ
jgi:endoglucanase